MKLISEILGEIEIDNNSIIEMVKPVIGFEEYREFSLFAQDENTPFKWMISIENPDLCFLVAEPTRLFDDYSFSLDKREVAELKLRDEHDASVMVIVSKSEQSQHLTANLLAPIIINKKTNRAKQHVLANSAYNLNQIIIPGLAENSKPVETESSSIVTVGEVL